MVLLTLVGCAAKPVPVYPLEQTYSLSPRTQPRPQKFEERKLPQNLLNRIKEKQRLLREFEQKYAPAVDEKR